MMVWQTMTLGEVAQIERGKFSHRPRNEPRFYGGGTPFVQTGDVTRSNGIIRTHTQTLNDDGVAISKVFPAGTILITIAANIGYAGILQFDSAAPDSLIGLTPGESVSVEFLNFYLRTQQPEMDRMAPKGTQKNINIEFLRPWPVIVPPLPEQKKIANILSTVQRAIEVQERIIQTTTELKKALMHKLFTEGLRGEPQKQTEIGPVPESWDLLPIGDLFDTQLGKMLSQKAKVGDSPKVYLRNKNVQWGRIDTYDLLRMDFSDREAEKFQLRRGDLLVCEGGEVGRAALWDGSIADCYYQKALHRLRPKTDQITNEFMVHWMMFAFLLTNIYGVTGTRTTIAHLPEIKLKPLLVPVPPPDEQGNIVRALETVDRKLAGHQGKLTALQDLFRTLLHKLMNAKIRVHELELPTGALAV